METELNPIEQLWMSEQTAVMYAFTTLGQIVVAFGMVLAVILFLGAMYFSDSETPSSNRGLSIKLGSAVVAARHTPGLGVTVLRAVVLIICLVAAAQI